VGDGDLRGKRALVTGASSGIGRALAAELARRGMDVALLARRRDRLAAVAAEVESLGRRGVALPCDVRDPDAVRAAVDAAAAALGGLDVAVANAGFGVTGRVDALSAQDFRRQLDTNLFGVLHTVHATLPHLVRSRGRLVLMGSVSGHVSFPGSAPYSMSKFAVRALADALDVELRESGVSVTLVSPGFVESEIRGVDNDGRHDPAAADPAPRWLVMPAAVAARKIATAVERRRRELVLTLHGKAAVWIHRHMPGLFRWVVARAMRDRSVERGGT
jgi:short-subunit dehydrogenase